MFAAVMPADCIQLELSLWCVQSQEDLLSSDAGSEEPALQPPEPQVCLQCKPYILNLFVIQENTAHNHD